MLHKSLVLIDGRTLLNELSTIPKTPGIYSWYRRLTVDESSPQDFNGSLLKQINTNSILPIFFGSTGPYCVNLSPQKTNLSKKKQPLANRLSRSEDHRSKFAHAFLVASIFQSPLYVGKANELAGRIKDHCKGKTGFSQRIKRHKLMPDSLVLAYISFEGLPRKTNELLEYIVSIVSAPPFVKRKG